MIEASLLYLFCGISFWIRENDDGGFVMIRGIFTFLVQSTRRLLLLLPIIFLCFALLPSYLLCDEPNNPNNAIVSLFCEFESSFAGFDGSPLGWKVQKLLLTQILRG